MRQKGGIPTIFVVMAMLGGFVAVVWINSTPAAPAAPFVPTQVEPTSAENSWQKVLQGGLGSNSTPLPTVAIPDEPLNVPTLDIEQESSPVGLEPAALDSDNTQVVASGATPTLPPPTPTDVPEDENVVVENVTQAPVEWRPPALIPPINNDPLGRDHYWFHRPVDSNGNNAILSWYAYGSDGPNRDNPYRVHHGVDMPNDFGKTVRAAGSGVVVWAADGRQEESSIFDNSPSYGNVIVIEHDFSYRGQPLYTIYAHLSAALVVAGEYVTGGEPIGLVGDSGRVSGPHVHFEVRVGENLYRATYNPVLWMVPYVGHGVIAGQVVDARGDFLNDMDVTVRNRSNGAVLTTTSYVFQDTGSDVNPDPQWRENFAVADVPVGRYDVIVTINGQRVVRQVEVLEGTTSFVELAPPEPVTVEPELDGG